MEGHAADARNSRASSGLPKKIGTGEQVVTEKEKERGILEKKSGLERGNRGEVLQFTGILLQGIHSGLIIPHLRFFTFYCHLLLVTDVWDAHFSFTV